MRDFSASGSAPTPDALRIVASAAGPHWSVTCGKNGTSVSSIVLSASSSPAVTPPDIPAQPDAMMQTATAMTALCHCRCIRKFLDLREDVRYPEQLEHDQDNRHDADQFDKTDTARRQLGQLTI